MKFDRYLHAILTRPSFDGFTVTDVMEAYVKESSVGSKVDRNWAYCQLRRLTKKRLLRKERQTSPARVVYRKTESFDAVLLEPRVDTDHVTTELAPTSVPDEHFIELILERAKATKVELLTCISEGEQYKELIREFPSISPTLEERYQQSCHRSTRALGKLRALETLVEEFSS